MDRRFRFSAALRSATVAVALALLSAASALAQTAPAAKVGIAYGADVSQAENLFLAVTGASASVRHDPAPERVAGDLRHDIRLRLAEAGIEIPFPQRDVRIDLAHALPVGITNERHREAIHAQ